MRKVFFAGAAVAVVFAVLNRAIVLLNQRSDLAVAAGYFLVVALIALAVGVVPRLWRRL